MPAVTDACGRQRESSGDPQSVLGRGNHDYWSGNAGQSAGAGPGRHGRRDVALLRDFNLGIGAGALVGNQISLHVSMSAIGYLGAIPALIALIWSVLIFRKWPVAMEEQTSHG